MAAIDITERFNSFREAARHLWNTWFRAEPQEVQDWDLRDAYSEVYAALFNAMVKRHLPEEAAAIPHLWSNESGMPSQYRLEPDCAQLPIMINRELCAEGYWDHPTTTVEAGSVGLALIGLFDWDELGFRDFKYFRARILTAADPDLIGRDALVEACYCRVLFVDRAIL